MCEAKEKIIDNIKSNEVMWETYPKRECGGQSAGVSYGVTLKCEEWGFCVSVNYSRSQLKNKKVAMELLTLYLDKIISL